MKDYGKGIEKKDFERIFQPFKQASAETELVYGGTGLGLAITAKLVQGLGGRISVDSEERQWSEFTVSLPFREAPVDISHITKQLQGLTICLVERDSEAASSSHLFNQFGVPCLEFCDVEKIVNMSEDSELMSPSRKYVWLVQEDLFDKESYVTFSRRLNSTLLSFGPKYEVEDTQGHFRSLTHVLPAVLMQTILKCVQATQAPQQTVVPPLRSVNTVPYHELRVLIAEGEIEWCMVWVLRI